MVDVQYRPKKNQANSNQNRIMLQRVQTIWGIDDDGPLSVLSNYIN